MNPIRLFLIILKEYIKKPGCIFIIMLIPILTVCINVKQDEIDEHSITIGYYFDYSNDDDDGSVKSIRNSINDYDGIYSFIEYEDIDQIKRDLILNKIECCYIVPANFSHIVYKEKERKSVEVYISNKSTMNSAINETFYSLLFPTMSETSLEKYLVKESAAKELFKDKTLTEKDVKKLYKKYLNNGSTFHFETDGEPEDYKTSTTSLLLSPLKGLIGLMILIAGLSGAFDYFKESDGLIKRNAFVRIVYILVPVLLTSVSAVLTIIVSNGKVSNKAISEILGAVAIYIAICVIFTFILTILIKSASLYASIIPMLIISTLVFTPFIIDFAVFVPIIKYISYILPPYYFISLL